MKEEKIIYGVSGGCGKQCQIRIKFPLSGFNKKLIEELEEEGFTFKIWGREGQVLGEIKNQSLEELSRLLNLLGAKGFKKSSD